MLKLKNLLIAVAKDESGASMVEYSVLIGIVTVAGIGAITTMGTRVGDWWDSLVAATAP